MTDEILLTEESIGQVFDLIKGEDYKVGTFEIAVQNKDSVFQGYRDKQKWICSHRDMMFNEHGKSVDVSSYRLKPQRKKIDLWEWEGLNLFSRISVHKHYVYIVNTREGEKIIAKIPLEEMQKRNFEYFYEGEGIDD